MIFSGLEIIRTEKRNSQKVVSLLFIFPRTGNLKILDESHYYPYGLKHQSYSSSGFIRNPYGDVIIAPVTNNPYKYKYNGKELQDELGLNMYDMDMRMYDPAIARWVVMDPVIHHTMSPYNAFDLNPVFWADPSGAEGESNNSSSDTESGGGSTPGAIGTDRYGNQTLNIGYGVNISAGTAAISVNNYGSSTGGKRNNSAKQNSNNTKIGSVSASWTPEDDAQFDGDPANHDPDAVQMSAVIANSRASLNAGLEQRANEALAIWSNWGTGSSFDLSYTMKKLNQVATATEGIAIFYEKYGKYNSPKNLKLLGNTAGYVGSLASAVGETNNYLNNDISGTRYTYRMTGIGASAGAGGLAGTYVGGPAGFVMGTLTGTTFGVGEQTYDVVAPQVQHSFNGFINQMKSSIMHSVNMRR